MFTKTSTYEFYEINWGISVQFGISNPHIICLRNVNVILYIPDVLKVILSKLYAFPCKENFVRDSGLRRNEKCVERS
jgi:hypothetical protein